jgi:hypothetical protein
MDGETKMDHIFNKRFGNLSVELNIDTDDCGTTECWISNGKYTGSLELLQQEGAIFDFEGYEMKVPENVINQIAEWAVNRGY